MTFDRLRKVFAFGIVLVLALPAPVLSEDDHKYSVAQMKLFGTPHLSNVQSEATLFYDFQQSGTDAEQLDDQVTIEITGIDDDGKKDVAAVFLNGDNNQPYRDVKGFQANPLIMFFLQWDVNKMGAATAVSHHSFRHIIVNSFVDQAQSKQITVPYQGQQIDGWHIVLQPFKKKHTARYKEFADKQYEFVMSESVPGGIYSIKTSVPGESGSSDLREYTELTFDHIRLTEESKSAM